MLLAPLWRTLCFMLVSGCLLQIALEFASWRMAPSADDSSRPLPARTLERRLLAFTLAARILPWVIACALLTPAYLRAEDNPDVERVSIFAILAACAAVFWIASTWVRAALLSWRTRRICDACHASGRTIAGKPVFVHPGSSSLIAVMGIFRSRLLVSERLLKTENVSSLELDIAVDHELAHAAHRDNLKLLLLAILPTLPFSSAAHSTLANRWRLAAELAADDDSTGHDAERSLLLADLLVRLARERSLPSAPRLATLLSAPQHLKARVEHLLENSRLSFSASSRPQQRSVLCASAVIAATAAIYLSLTFGHGAAEFLLHLGS
jgi:hypothetical protein